MFTEPAASTAKRSRTQSVKQQTQSDNGPQSPSKRSAKTAKHRPDLSQDEHLKYLPISTLAHLVLMREQVIVNIDCMHLF